ncbi:MAG: carboxymuconolactone decarboxylase family protein, partial [Spirochaetaceae bacterium]
SIRIAQLNGCFFCIDLNSFNFLRAAGQQEKATQIERWRESEIYTPAERAALEYAETMTERCASVGDAEIATLREFFTDDEITGLTAWIAFQNMSAKFNAALGAEEHGFCRLPPRE